MPPIMPPYNTRFNRINWDWLGRKKALKPYMYYDLRAILECLEQLFGAGGGIELCHASIAVTES